MPTLIDQRYEIVSEAGRGGLGTAFLARDRSRGGAQVALKVLREVGPDRRALLEAEFRALARIAHPAIPPVRDLGAIRSVDGGTPDPSLRPGALYLARDFVDGDDLFAATRGKSWAEVRQLAIALARALGAVHARGLAHGDLKPGNILVLRRPEPGEPPVRLIDFGAGATVEYLAPERIRGAPPGPRADLYALGATLYRVLGGEPPHPGRTQGEVARAALEGSPVPLGRRAPGLPPEVEAAVMRLLERVPARRFASAAAFLRALGEAEAAGADDGPLPVSLEAAPLAGREAERALLEETAAMAPGRPRVLVVTGGPGLGKSRLLREAAIEARLRGLRVARASGRPGAAPLALVHEALPEIAGARPQDGDSLEPRGPAALRALDAVATRVLAIATAAPLALVLDDLDRASEEDRALVGLLGRRLAGARAAPLVIFASASAGVSSEGAVGQRPTATGDTTRPPLDGARIALTDLPREAVVSLVRGALGLVALGEDALIAEVARRAGGNPALAAAALASLARSGALVAGAGGARFSEESVPQASGSGGGPVAHPASEAGRSAAPADPRARSLAAALHVLARPAPIGLAAAAAGLDPADAREAFGLLAHAGLALETEGRLALAPSVSLDGASSKEVARRAADALAAEAGSDPAERGRLLLEADAPPEEAGAALLEGGRRALASLAWRRARALLERALPLLPSPRRPEGLRALGEALLAGGAAAEAAARLSEAAALAPSDAGLLLLLAEAEAARNETAAALARIEAARAAAGSAEERSRADLLEGRVRLSRGDLPGAETALRRSLGGGLLPGEGKPLPEPLRPQALPGEGKPLPEPLRPQALSEVRAAALGDLAGVCFRRAAPAAAAELLVEAARIERARGRARGRAVCHGRLGHALEALGDRAAARRHHLRAVRLWKRDGDRAGLSFAWSNLANLARNEGDLARAERLYRRSIRLKRELGLGAALELANLGLTRAGLGRPQAALRPLAAACKAARASGETVALVTAEMARAEALSALGRFGDAMKAVQALREIERARPQTYRHARSRWALAHVLLARGKPARAARQLRRAERALAKAGHPVDLARVHALLSEAHRRTAGLPPVPVADGGAALRGRDEGSPAASPDAAAALEAERRRGARLLGAAAALAAERDVARLLGRLCEEAVAALGAERAFVVLRREDGGLEFAASRNLEREAVLRAESKAPHALIERVIEEGRAIASADALRDPRLAELTSVQMLDVRSVLALPIREPGGAPLGALYLDHRLKPGGFGEERRGRRRARREGAPREGGRGRGAAGDDRRGEGRRRARRGRNIPRSP